MLKSILTGATTGILLSGTAAVGLAMLFPAAANDTPPATPQMDVPIANVDPSGDRDTAALDVVTDRPNTADAPAANVTADAPSDPDADTAPLSEPEVADMEDAMTAPTEGASDVAISTTTEEPVLPNPQSLSLEAPSEETQVAISTQTAEPPAAPVIVDETEVAIIVEEDAPVIEPVIVDEDDNATPATDSDVATDMATEDDTAEAVADVVVDTNPAAQVVSPTVLSIVTDDGETLPTGDSRVQVNRPTDSTAAEETAEAPQAAVDPNAPARTRFAAPFENPEGKPLLSVVLFDRNEISDGTLALSQLGFPVTIVLDPASEDVEKKMDRYRSVGLEVAVMPVLPSGATPADIEVILGGVFAQLPETIGLVDIGETGLQADRDVIEQVMAVLSDDGRGLLTISRGLNTALRAADEADVPATTIYRDIDTEWQSSRVIRRFLDQAAFRARQQSGVVLFGRLRPNTLTALKNWGRSDRAQQIAIAPLSAIWDAGAN